MEAVAKYLDRRLWGPIMSAKSEKKRKTESERFRRVQQLGADFWDTLDNLDSERSDYARHSQHNNSVNAIKKCRAEHRFMDRLREVGLFRTFKELWSDDS